MEKPVLFALIGLACGTLGALHYVSRVREQLSGGAPLEWLILKKDLPRGQVLTADALGTALIPELYSDPRRVPAKEMDGLIGIPVAVALKAGEGLYWTDLAGGDASRSHLADVIPVGRRAFRLPPTANPLGTLVEAGDLVDVLCAGTLETQTVLERVLVLAVGDKLDRPEAVTKALGASSEGLSLSVLREEAESLLFAEKNCQLRVVLRSPGDMATRVNVSASRRNSAVEDGGEKEGVAHAQ